MKPDPDHHLTNPLANQEAALLREIDSLTEKLRTSKEAQERLWQANIGLAQRINDACGWLPISTPPPVELVVALHFVWGEVRDGWRLADGRYRTASMPIPQETETITHWAKMPINPQTSKVDL